jgi:Cutinase
MHEAIPKLDQSVKDQIAAAVMFGDTRNKQDKGQIPTFPPEKTKIFCNQGDDVCDNKIRASLLGAHLKYHPSVPEALNFLRVNINTALEKKLKSSGSTTKSTPKKTTGKTTGKKAATSESDDSDSDASDASSSAGSDSSSSFFK